MAFNSYGKNKRIVDRDLLDSYRGKPCVVCGREGEAHHVKTRRSYGHDLPYNLMPLDREHHTEVHAIGLTTFAEKYLKVKTWLVDNGWEYDSTINKWRHE